ncbi:site-specific integrase [Bacteroides fragilis]|mgnify:CR=1 FL=1|jgi:site-specific recombinase XerD|uniref:site-specific integrase n=1 Tax=Bacteroides fragilis TaxID=817 RepID=UPI00202DC8F5|nr:site-specific integrase [Bacteroides fragilis]DAO85589.1 MAG TPA: SITE SPECIFIC RECOMBINASE XERD [Caudoviricetes sp.]MCM0194073.1 tyrosine-type recombinase/integrase [Bacteroides fragilis]MCM0201423.1 tyrosine-type recombinase/integrase [Bacteroides fragilis]MCM0211992.1 tyrosine-type recombinase/integrase [Bacteroides fragilis]MCM0216421.1 tyrosine-type recombinase/integrase [Bacteroides fragilis]
MNNSKIFHEDLTRIFESGLLSYQVSERMRRELMARLRHLLNFMLQKNICSYDESVGQKFIEYENNEVHVSAGLLARDARTILLLNSISKGEAYPARKRTLSYQFPGDLGVLAKTFLTEEIMVYGFSRGTTDAYKSNLSRFSVAMDLNNITLKNISTEDLIRFLSTMPNTRSYAITPIRRFLKYMYQKNHIADNLSIVFENIKTKKPVKLPSYYSKEEVLKIENSVDRSGRVGKRNYAVILLASRLGIRASDIANLKLSNIDWDNNQIRFTQIKMNKAISLPLLTEVGNSIIDYIIHGRPNSSVKNIFVTFTRPYKALGGSAITGIVDKYMRESNINLDNRHHGAHSLRHSVATALMDNNVSLPIISDVLGHQTTLSTVHYLEINLEALIECSLDVPMVNDNFYNQHGGFFYE